MTEKISIDHDSLMKILSYMKDEGIIQNTYQLSGVKCSEVNGEKRIHLDFEEWSYPFVAGREHTRSLPKQFYELVNWTVEDVAVSE